MTISDILNPVYEKYFNSIESRDYKRTLSLIDEIYELQFKVYKSVTNAEEKNIQKKCLDRLINVKNTFTNLLGEENAN